MRSKILACAVLALASAGCASLDLGPRNKVAQNASMDDYFAMRLEAGRDHLQKGHVTKAIEAFRQASYSPLTAPEAFNGMGVSYSMLGRDDVARQLFERAIEQDPSDERYWRNLARVDERIMLAKKSTPSQTGVGISPNETAVSSNLPDAEPPVQGQPRRPVQAKALRTARVREVFITTAQDDPAVSVTRPQRSAVRIVARPASAAVGRTVQSSQYPIRIELAPSKKVAISTRRGEDAQRFPIRVALDQ